MALFSDLVSEVRIKARLNANDADATTRINTELNNALYQLARAKKIPELYITRFPISLAGAAGTGQVTLPDNFLYINRVIYTAADANKTWELADRSGVVPISPVPTWPEAYEVTSNQAAPDPSELFGLILSPSESINEGDDELRIDFYAKFDTLTGPSVIPSAVWNAEVVNIAVANIMLTQDKTVQAKLMFNQTELFSGQNTSQPTNQQ